MLNIGHLKTILYTPTSVCLQSTRLAGNLHVIDILFLSQTLCPLSISISLNEDRVNIVYVLMAINFKPLHWWFCTSAENKKWSQVVTNKIKCKTEIDGEREKHSTTMLLSAEPHTNRGEEACRRPVMEANAHRKQVGTDRKPATTQQQGSHSPATTSAYCKLLIHKQTNQLKDSSASLCLPVCLSVCKCVYM